MTEHAVSDSQLKRFGVRSMTEFRNTPLQACAALLVIFSAAFGAVYQVIVNPFGRSVLAYALTAAVVLIPAIVNVWARRQIQQAHPMTRLLGSSIMLWANSLLLMLWFGITIFVMLQANLFGVVDLISPQTSNPTTGTASLRSVVWIYGGGVFLQAMLVGPSIHFVCRDYESLVLGIVEVIRPRSTQQSETQDNGLDKLS